MLEKKINFLEDLLKENKDRLNKLKENKSPPVKKDTSNDHSMYTMDASDEHKNQKAVIKEALRKKQEDKKNAMRKFALRMSGADESRI